MINIFNQTSGTNGSASSKKYTESIDATNTQPTQLSFTEQTVSHDNEFLQTSIYADVNDNFPTSQQEQVTEHVMQIEPKSHPNVAMKKISEIVNPPPSLLRPQSHVLHARVPRIGSIKARNEIHSRNCRAPTALSIDIHNAKTINGPHSCLRTMLELKNATLKLDDDKQTKSILVTSKSVNNLYNNNDEKNVITSTSVKGKILKKIYYKSAWYDVPPGSSKRRFKSYVKVAPNA